MNGLLLWFGRLSGVAGVLMCAVAGAARLGGQRWLFNFELVTLFQGGMAAMILGCLCLLAVLTKRAG